MKETNVMVLDSINSDYAAYFKENGYSLIDPMDNTQPIPDLIVFTGGTDISPSLYKEKKIRQTQKSDNKRDEFEIQMYKRGVFLNIPMIGICRGAQFLNVMNGGTLIQHITGHTSGHDVTTYSGKKFKVTSSHHQMMIPLGKYEVLATSSTLLSEKYLTGEGEAHLQFEYECVYYPKTNSLCVQWHPEWMSDETDGYTYPLELLKKLIEETEV